MKFISIFMYIAGVGRWVYVVWTDYRLVDISKQKKLWTTDKVLFLQNNFSSEVCTSVAAEEM